MKKITASVLGWLLFFAAGAQNPVSYPRDTIISKPELNFEVLWHTFEDNYAFFQLRNINWRKDYEKYRPMVHADTPDDSLYSIFTRMLAPFHDNHINLIVPGVRQFKSVKPSQFVNEFPSDSLREAFWQLVDQCLAKKQVGPLQYIGPVSNGKPLFTYAVGNNIGYLRFNRCFVDGNADNVPDAAVAGRMLDTVFETFKSSGTLIVDVRDNIGGNDEFAFEVANRFAKTKTVGMYKQTRITGAAYDSFSKPDTWYLQPKTALPFERPVIVLTNDKTVSAGDVFAMIMKALPNVKIFGSNTRGIYSDMYGFTLPNGWQLSLSNQKYFNNKMVCYEGTGTPVDRTILNTRRDLAASDDPVLNAAINALNKK